MSETKWVGSQVELDTRGTTWTREEALGVGQKIAEKFKVDRVVVIMKNPKGIEIVFVDAKGPVKKGEAP